MIRSLLIGAIVLGGIAPAVAHVTLEAQEANIGMPYKAVLRVPHGCEGSATVTLRVRIPDGVIAVKPMPKPGWMLSTASSTGHCNTARSLSAGVSKPKVFRGR
jgi:periplasmic copper chaperone A